MEATIISFPKQRLLTSQKGKDWRERHLRWAENVRYLNNGKVRKSLINKKINFDLYAGKIHLSDLKLYVNPYEKVSSYIPNKIQHYPIMNQPLDLIVGEEINRRTSMSAVVANPDAISELEENKITLAREQVKAYLVKDIDPNMEQQEAKTIQKYLNYNYQDIREVQANWVLNDAIKNVDFHKKLNEGLKHVTICSEEIYLFDIVSGEVVMENLNPKKVYTFRSGQSSRIEDSDILIIDDYWSPGRIQDTFYDKLKPADYTYLDELITNPSGSAGNGAFLDPTKEFIYMPSDDPSENLLNDYIGYANELGMPSAQYVDYDGNIRVLRIYWKSQRKIYKRKRYDPETGDPIEDYVDENYKANVDMGEELTPYWTSEWWQGTKIGNGIYIDIRPKELQYRRMSNPSWCHPGIVGQIYNTNQLRGQSMVDKMKPLAYLFDTIMDRLLKLVANHIGKVPEVDLAKVAWDDVDKFLHFVRTENIAFSNSFKESNKGVASGQYNTVGGKNFDFDQSDSIRMYTELLAYIKSSMYDVVGVTPQRLGETSSRETMGGIERAVTQSSHITSEIFSIHDNVKKRCAEILLETAKYTLKGNKKKVQYVTTEGITAILEIDGNEFCERDYGIYVENDLDIAGLRQKVEQIAQAWSQNDTVKPSTLLSIFTDKSLESMKRKLEADYDEKVQREMEQFQQQQQQSAQQTQTLQQIEQFKMQLEQQKLELEDLMNQRNNATKVQIKMLEMQNTQGENNTLDIEKLQLEKEKIDKDIEFKYKQLTETIRSNMATEAINRNKPVTKSK